MNSQDKTEQLENEKRSQNERISLGRKVEKTIKTSGWKLEELAKKIGSILLVEIGKMICVRAFFPLRQEKK